MSELLLALPMAVDRDVVAGRAAARAAAQVVGFAAPQQTRFATAVSELLRTTVSAVGGGELELALTQAAGGARLDAVVTDRGPRPSQSAAMAEGTDIARRLTEHFETVTIRGERTRVAIGIALPSDIVVDDAAISRWRQALAGVVGRSDLDHLRDRNLEMAAMLDQLAAQVEETERALAELAEARRAAEAASASKASYLAHLSHEIRTPLHAMLGFTELLEATPLTSDQQELLGPIRSSGLHLRSLIDDTLDLSKIEAGRLELATEPFPLRACLQAALELVTAQAAARQVELIAEVAADVPAMVVGDATRVRQILANYLSNAVKFSQGTPVVVRVTAESTEEAAVVCFEVRDRGIGIPAELHDRLFRAFTQADSSTARDFGGTGLGLTITRSLAEMMGGRVWFESEPGVGSTFCATVVLPVAAGSDQASSAEPAHGVGAAIPSSEPDVIDPATAGLRVLLVDDSPPSQALGVRMLAALGVHAVVATDGRAAVEAVTERPYDLVFMDLDMPVMNGFAASRAIRALGSAVHQPRIIATTANTIEGERDRCLAAGMDDYLPKPINRSQLAAKLQPGATAARPSRTTTGS